METSEGTGEGEASVLAAFSESKEGEGTYVAYVDEGEGEGAGEGRTGAGHGSPDSKAKGTDEESKEQTTSLVTLLSLDDEELALISSVTEAGPDIITGSKKKAQIAAILSKLNHALQSQSDAKGAASMKSEEEQSGGATREGGSSSETGSGDTASLLPCEYRIVIHPGALTKIDEALDSPEVAKIPVGTLVTVEEIKGRRARISKPTEGWISLISRNGETVALREGTKGKLMDDAVHSARARQTKVLILKSITTLEEPTVIRILEKADWNLRRSIEAFYMAKYKTAEYMKKKHDGQSAMAVDDDGSEMSSAASSEPKSKSGFLKRMFGSV